MNYASNAVNMARSLAVAYGVKDFDRCLPDPIPVVGRSATVQILTWRNGYPEIVTQPEKGVQPMAKTKKGGKKKGC